MSGDAQGTRGTFTMTGGSLTYSAADGPLFYVTNSTGVIVLKGVSLGAASGILVKVGCRNWGTRGSNGGSVILKADSQSLSGSLVADKLSSLDISLKDDSTLGGAINPAKAVNLSLDATSTWTVGADSCLTALLDAAGVSGSTTTNITGRGHTVS
jgi:hypothetical protein